MTSGRSVFRGSIWLVVAVLLCGILIWRMSRVRNPGGVSDRDPGRRAYRDGRWKEAEALARLRLRAVPDDRDALRLLARSTARLGQDALANSLFARLGEQALAAEDLYLLGLGLDHAGAGERALKVWEKALVTDPEHPETLERLAVAYSQHNRLVEAAQLSERLSRLPGWELRGGVNLGSLHMELNDPTASVAALQSVLARPDVDTLDATVRRRAERMLARGLLRLGRAAEAKPLLLQLVSQPDDQEAFWLLSRAALQLGEKDQAMAAIQKSGGYRAEHPLELEPAPYMGEGRCAECHREIAQAYHGSRFTTTLVRGADLLTLPYPQSPYPDPELPSVLHRYEKKEGQVHVETQAEGKVLRAIVDYAFGSPDRYSSLVGHDAQGRSYVLRLSYFHNGPDASGWVRTTGHSSDAGGGHDLQGKALDPADGVLRCLFCHTTNPVSVLKGMAPEAHDRAIGCERCHGPGGNHVKAVDVKLADMAVISPVQGSGEASVRLCGQCHALHQELDVPRTDTYWTRYQGNTLLWSRCFTESGGALDCTTCHDPHRNAIRSKSYYEAKCLSCHASGATGTAKKKPVRACPINPATGCVGCHMPPFRSEPLRATFADHFIRVHPELR